MSPSSTTRSSDGASTSERKIIDDLCPPEHFTRVIRRASVDAMRAFACARRRETERCAVTSEAERRARATLGRRAMRMRSFGRPVGPTRRRKRARVRSARAVGRRATREAAAGALDVAPEDIVRSLSMPLRRADVDSLLVLCGLGGVELQPRELMLVMERNVFGACVEALKTCELETLAEQVDGVDVAEGEPGHMNFSCRTERSLVLVCALARAQKFPPTKPRGTRAEAAAERAAIKARITRVMRTVRRIRWKMKTSSVEAVKSTRRAPVLDDRSPARGQSTSESKTPPRSRAQKRPAAAAAAGSRPSSASKRICRDRSKPLVLKLREPKIFGSRRLGDVTNSATTRRVVESVSKAASGLLRRSVLMSAVKRSGPLPRTSADDISLAAFPKLPR